MSTKKGPPVASDGPRTTTTRIERKQETMLQPTCYPDTSDADRIAAITALVQQLAAAQEHKAQIIEQESTLKEALRGILGTGSHRYGGLNISITPNRRFNVDLAERAYPREQHPDLYTLALDPKKAKAHIAPTDYAALMSTVGDPRVTLR